VEVLLKTLLAAKRSIALLAFEHISGRAEVLPERPLVITRSVAIAAVVAVVLYTRFFFNFCDLNPIKSTCYLRLSIKSHQREAKYDSGCFFWRGWLAQSTSNRGEKGGWERIAPASNENFELCLDWD
jgi:hypothetical protein